VSLPRPIRPGLTYLVTRRCTQQLFLLVPRRPTSQIFLYCLAYAQRMTGVRIHAVAVMSNHYHIVLTDDHGRLPEFDYILNKYVAKCMNALYGRWENVWVAGVQPSHVTLGDDAAMLEKAAYTITNPVEAELVPRHEEWPGLLLWRPGRYEGRRPDVFFRKTSRMPMHVELEITPLPLRSSSGPADVINRLGDLVARREKAFGETVRREKRRFCGAKKLADLRHTDSPSTLAERRRISPRVASRDKWRRLELLQRAKQFVVDHRDAFRRWVDGERDVVFPAGCYRMRLLFGVRCADC
jgi:putative transposase